VVNVFQALTISNNTNKSLMLFWMSFVLLLDCLAYYTPSLKSKIHFKIAIKNYNIVFFLLLSFPHKLKNADF